MFKNANGNLNKLFSGNKWIIVLVVAVLIFLFYSYSQSKGTFFDKMTDGSVPSENASALLPLSGSATASATAPSSSGNFSALPSNNNYSLQPVANPSELLPKDKNSEWASLNPVSAGGGSIQTPDLLQSGYHIGIDTIGQTLKNPSYDLRSDPIIEKKSVSPWNMSTIEPDLARVPLEVGYGSR
jgi:hypothetical protein